MKLLKKPIVVLIILGFISCKMRPENYNSKVSIFDTYDLKSISELDLKSLNPLDSDDWSTSDRLIKVDTNFYNEYLSQLLDFKRYDKNYQDLFLAGKIEVSNKPLLVICQKIKNGKESYMFLVKIDNDRISRLMNVSEIFYAPDDYIVSKSELKDSVIKRTKIWWYADIDNIEPETKDSIIEEFDLDNWTRTKYDSIRIK